MWALRGRAEYSGMARRLLIQYFNKGKHISVYINPLYDVTAPILTFSNVHRKYCTAKEQKKPETSAGTVEKREFKAETRMLLDIVARSLYSDKEVFIRELISNASDALEKFRYISVSASDKPLDAPDRSLQIKIGTDKQNRTITFEDSGIGMTKEELTENLGTIARSGSKHFIEEIKNKGADQASNIIGQFGVGFYSAFMVADKIEVFTRSSTPGSMGLKWSSDGSGTYEIQEIDNLAVGTKIVVYLKIDCREFADEQTVENVIQKYSNFVSSPIFLNDKQINSIKPLWLMEPKEVKAEDHTEFYRFISNSYDKPRYTLHYKTDVPISIRSILYVPEGKPGLFELSRDGDVGVALYSRKILIKNKADNIIPKWMRFVKGVVDSEDIPLNLSRELLQNNNLILKLKTVITNRFVKFMVDQASKDAVNYDNFHKDYSIFVKEGIITSQSPVEREEIAKLLRFESSKLGKGVRTSLQEYAARQKEDQKTIYYLAAPSRALAESSPYFESMKKRDVEVLFCYEMYDEMVLLELKEFGGKALVSVESDMQKDPDDKVEPVIGSDGLQQTQLDELIKFLKTKLTGKVFEVRCTSRLDTHPCVVIVPEMAAARHFVRTKAHEMSEENQYSLLRPQLEINPKHPLIKKLYKLTSTDAELANMVAQQMFSNAMMTAGLVMDPRNMITHINDLLVKALDKY